MPTATPTATATASPIALPTELSGTWQTDVGTGAAPDRVLLTLDGRSYRIRRGTFSGTGAIAVDGHTITFSNNAQCEIDTGGGYEWAVADGVLTFTPAEPSDPCPRIEVLAAHPWERVEG